VTFEPSVLSYEDLLERWFFRLHNPTTLNRQGNDVGTQYRSAIFPRTREQQLAAEQGVNGRRRTTVEEILPPSKKRRALVAAGLILAFSGMLLATHKYVTQRWNPLGDLPRVCRTSADRA